MLILTCWHPVYNVAMDTQTTWSKSNDSWKSYVKGFVLLQVLRGFMQVYLLLKENKDIRKKKMLPWRWLQMISASLLFLSGGVIFHLLLHLLFTGECEVLSHIHPPLLMCALVCVFLCLWPWDSWATLREGRLTRLIGFLLNTVYSTRQWMTWWTKMSKYAGWTEL